MRVLLQYLSAPLYPKSLFRKLADEPRIEFAIACGRTSPYPGLKNFWPPESGIATFELRNHYIRVGQRVLTAQRGIFRAVREFKPDCVILLGVDPHIVSNFALVPYLKGLEIPVVWWGHATWGQQGALGTALRTRIYQSSAGALVYDRSGARRLVNAGLPPSRVQVVNNCLNHSAYRSEPREIYTGGPFRMVFSGRLTRPKRLDIAVHAMAELKRRGLDCVLDVIGDGPERSVCERIAAESDIRNSVRFHGARYGQDADLIIGSAHVGVIPSAAGLSVIHYMAQGVPVLVGDDLSKHKPEIHAVRDGENGGYFRHDQPVSLADQFERMLPRIAELGERARLDVQREFSPSAVGERIVEGLGKILASRGEAAIPQ